MRLVLCRPARWLLSGHCGLLAWQALGALPFAVALDHEGGAVVVSVRGTISVNDVVTDFLATPEALHDWLPAAFTQVGFMQCAPP